MKSPHLRTFCCGSGPPLAAQQTAKQATEIGATRGPGPAHQAAQCRHRVDPARSRFGHAAFSGGGPGGGFRGASMEDIFSAFGDIFGGGFGDLFGGRRGRSGPQPGRDLKVVLDLTLEEIDSGVERTISQSRATKTPPSRNAAGVTIRMRCPFIAPSVTTLPKKRPKPSHATSVASWNRRIRATAAASPSQNSAAVTGSNDCRLLE